MKKITLCAAITLVVSAAFPPSLIAKPERIKAGIPYYSDQYESVDGRYELAEEKNFEEVYKNFNYYEAVYDKKERIVIFNAFEKGELEFSEVYYYDEGTRPVKKEVTDSSGKKSVIDLYKKYRGQGAFTK